MNFSNKLIELRKKAGLSQEELGDKLNVTRQTVSKWELGITTPDVNKIKELSNIFKISLEDLLNEDIKTENVKIENKKETIKKDNKRREKIVLGVLVGVLIISIGTLSYFGIRNFKNNKSNEENQKLSIFEKFFGTFKDIQDETENKFEYSRLENMYKGTKRGTYIKKAIDDINNLNNKGSNIIIMYQGLKYNKDNLDKLKANIKDGKYYNISFEYKNEKIIKVNIKREITEMDKNSHNKKLEFSYTGTIKGAFLKNAIDEIIRINLEDEKVILLQYLDEQYSEINDIRNIKKSIDDFSDYEVYHEYDMDGFINKTIISILK